MSRSDLRRICPITGNALLTARLRLLTYESAMYPFIMESIVWAKRGGVTSRTNRQHGGVGRFGQAIAALSTDRNQARSPVFESEPDEMTAHQLPSRSNVEVASPTHLVTAAASNSASAFVLQ